MGSTGGGLVSSIGGVGSAIGGAFGGGPGALLGGVGQNKFFPGQEDPLKKLWGINQGGGDTGNYYLGPEPTRPEFQSNIDDSTGLLKSPYNLDPSKYYNNQETAVQALRDRALGTGPSAWQTAALQQQGLNEQGAKNAAQQQGAAGLANARSGLASRGGLSGGAAERLAGQASRDQMAALQNVGFKGAQDRANIGLQDQQMKNEFLTTLPGQEQNLALGNIGVANTNIQRALADKAAKNTADMDAYKEQLAAYGGRQQGQAIRQSSGNGGKK